MKPIPVYCDTGALTKELRSLEKSGTISIHQFMYENKTRKIQKGAIPSDLKYGDNINYTYEEFGSVDVLKNLTYDKLGGTNSKYDEILTIVGKDNRTDAQHLDSAQMTSCKYFLTSDKTDIWSNRKKLGDITDLKTFLIPSELNIFINHIHECA